MRKEIVISSMRYAPHLIFSTAVANLVLPASADGLTFVQIISLFHVVTGLLLTFSILVFVAGFFVYLSRLGTWLTHRDPKAEFGALAVRFQPVPHYIPANAVEFTDGGGRFTFGADCGPSEALIEFASGTDLLLLNSMASVICEEGLENQEFIQKHLRFSDGERDCDFAKFHEFLKAYAPEKVEQELGVSARDGHAGLGVKKLQEGHGWPFRSPAMKSSKGRLVVR